MAVVLIDGFDVYNGVGTSTGLQSKWTAVTSTGGTSLVAGRFGGQALSIGSVSREYARTLPAAISSVALGVAMKGALPTTDNMTSQIGFKIGTTWQVGLRVNASGGIDAQRKSSGTAGTLLGSSGNGIIASGIWYYIEVAVVFHGTTGSVVVKLNGVEVINLSNVNTSNSGTTIDTITLCESGSGGILPTFDDLYVNDTNVMLGERRVETLYPTSDVAQGWTRSTGTTNYTLVDEAQVNGDTDYVQATNVGDVDTYGFGDLSSTPSAISAIQVNAFGLKTDAATRQIALQVKSGATTSDGSDNALAASYAKFERILTTDPNTSSAWTASGVNALEGGPKVTV